MTRFRGRRWIGWMSLTVLALALRAYAHTLPISYLYVVPDAGYLHLELMLNPFELNFFSEIDANRDGRLDPGELANSQQEVLTPNGQARTPVPPPIGGLTRRILDCLIVRVGGKPVVPEVAGLSMEVDGHHLTLRAQYPVDARSAVIEVESHLANITSASHLTQTTCVRAGQRQLAQLDSQTAVATFEPADPTPTARPIQDASSPVRGEWRFGSMILVAVVAGLSMVVLVLWMGRAVPAPVLNQPSSTLRSSLNKKP